MNLAFSIFQCVIMPVLRRFALVCIPLSVLQEVRFWAWKRRAHGTYSSEQGSSSAGFDVFPGKPGKKHKEGQAVQGKVKRAPSFLPFAYLASLTSS